MAQNKEEQKNKPVKQNQPKPLEPQNKKEIPYTHKTLFNGFSLVVALLGFLIATGALYSNYILKKSLAEKETELHSVVTQMQEKQKHFQNHITSQVANKAEGIRQSEQSLKNKIQAMDQQLHTAMNQKFYQNQDWLLLKARYYMELAQINAHWSTNYSASISLLQQADKLLESLSNSNKVFSVRQALAKEIAQLKSIPTVDVVGLLGKLDAVQGNLDHLTLQDTVRDELKNNASPEIKYQSPTSSAWKLHLHDSLNVLKKLVVIRRDDENITPLMSPLYEAALKESITINLQEAQWAILNQNSEVYDLSIKRAISNLKRIYNIQLPHTIAMLNQLTELQHVKINQEKPTLDLALPLLNQMIDNQESLIKSPQDDSKGGQ